MATKNKLKNNPAAAAALTGVTSKKPAAKRASVKDAVNEKFGKPARRVAAATKSTDKATTKVKAVKKATGLGEAMADAMKPVKKAAPATVLRYKGFVLPLARKPGEDDTNVPTIEVKTISDTVKLFEKLPKGCTWGTSGDNCILNVYNAKGMLIAELRTPMK